MGSPHYQLSIAAPAWTAVGAAPRTRVVRAIRVCPRHRDRSLPAALLISAAAHVVAAATLGTVLLSDAPVPRGDGNPVQAAMSITITAPPAPALPPVAPPPDPVRKPPAAFQPLVSVAPRVIATRANPVMPAAFTVPAPKPVFLAKALLLPAADSGSAELVASAGSTGNLTASVNNIGAGSGSANGVAQAVAIVHARPDYAHNPPPSYPQTARLRGWQGTVILSVEVLPDGGAGEVGVVKSSGRRVLDEAAMQAVRGWRFLPARVNQDPIRSLVEIPVSFRLTNT
ncbi:MAG: hypothetical protein A2107_14435 [Verrucomicrobia bacterium GWF2_62_7]|nr:MAG: hypothetical protein A2107_14435 [Verrucomicrobia bacterium GWF2_62_7]